ncbi:MAG: tetratricopeptide repeat protein [Deltaproteobacteria bacterium]|nr:tetratricopeptide repeat protein [Deltaproteobacteria bacterium]
MRLLTAMATILIAIWPTAGSAQERHLGEGKHVPLLTKAEAFQRQGDAAMERGDRKAARPHYDKAVALYQEVMVLQPNLVVPYVRVSRIFGIFGEHLKAAALLKRVRTRMPDNLDVKQQLSIHLVLGGYLAEGIPLLEEVAQTRPAVVQLQALLADHYRKTGQSKKAIVVLERILKVRPRAHNRRVEYGEALLQNQRYNDALAAFRMVKRGDFAWAARFGEGKVLDAMEQPEQALKILITLESLPAPTVEHRRSIYRKIADIQRGQGKYQPALIRYRAYTKVWPKDSRGFYGAGYTLYLAGRYRESEEQYQYSLRLFPRSPRTHAALAKTYLKLGDLKTAVSRQQRAIALAPSDWQLKSMLGTLYRKGGKPKEATALHEKLLASRKWSALLFAELGHDQFYQGQVSAAEQSYRQALKRDIQQVGARHGMVILGLAAVAQQVAKRQLDEATRRLTQLQRYRALNWEILEKQASIALERGDEAYALKLLDKVEERRRSRWDHRLLRGRTLLALGRAEPAYQALTAIKGNEVKRPRAQLALSMTLATAEMMVGKADSAIVRLRQLVNSGAAPARSSRLLAMALLRRATTAFVEKQLTRAQNDLEELGGVANRLPKAEQLRYATVGALVSAELGKKEATLKHLKALARQKTAPFLASSYASAEGLALLRAYVLTRVGEHERAIGLLTPLLRGTPSEQVVEAYRGALRQRAVALYQAGKYKEATRALETLKKQIKGGKLLAADEVLVACIDYQLGNREKAAGEFTRLASQVPLALANLGVYQDDVKHDKKAAYEAYAGYLKHSMGHALPQVKRWADTKRRIFGFGKGGAQ